MARGLAPDRVLKSFAAASAKSTSAPALRVLAQSTAEMVRELPPERAAETCASAAQLLITAMTRTTGEDDLSYLAAGIAALTKHLTPARADYVCGAAIKILTEAMTRTTNPFALERLTDGFVALSPRAPTPNGPHGFSRCSPMSRSSTTDGLGLSALTTSVREVATQLTPYHAALRRGVVP